MSLGCAIGELECVHFRELGIRPPRWVQAPHEVAAIEVVVAVPEPDDVLPAGAAGAESASVQAVLDPYRGAAMNAPGDLDRQPALGVQLCREVLVRQDGASRIIKA